MVCLHPCVDDNSTAPLAPGLLPNQTPSVFVCYENVKAKVLSIPCETGTLSRRRDLCAGRELGVLCDHNDPVPHKVKVAIDVFIRWEGFDHNVITNPHILIEDRAFDMTVPANANGKIAARFFHIVIICAHQDAVLDHCPLSDLAANPHDGMGDLCLADAAAFRDEYIFQFAIFHDGTWQKAGMSEYGRFGIIKIERRVCTG